MDPYNLDALMMLGVSYTNDLESSRALNYLKRWLENNPDYQNQQARNQHIPLCPRITLLCAPTRADISGGLSEYDFVLCAPGCFAFVFMVLTCSGALHFCPDALMP